VLRTPFLSILCLLTTVTTAGERIDVSNFSTEGLSGWEQKHFVGESRYTIEGTGGEQWLHAESGASASGCFREIKIDLKRTPWLNWSWRIGGVLNNSNEREKSGDDYPARVYVVFENGPFFWNANALNYVWSSCQPVESHWPNAYTDNAVMLAVASGGDEAGKWISLRRNVAEDIRQQFGVEPHYITAIAVMSDSDNTGSRVEADYRQLFFSGE